ncbi:MAG: hypothetical protein P8J14_13175 [Emcibacteraceae bacterium]|nr:hypothetical protein [Emcibacteraceae bacterium]
MNFFLVLALFINAMAPLSAVFSNPTHEDDAAIEALFGDKILICTPLGYKYVSLNELDGMSDEQKQNSSSHCSLCLITTGDDKAYIADLNTFIKIELQKASLNYYALKSVLKSNKRFSPSIPRAPPILSLI